MPGRPERPRRRSHLRPGPLAFSALSTVLFLLGIVLHAPALWLGFLLALPLMITATGLGWRAALPLMPIGLILAGLRATHEPLGLELSGMALLLVLGAAAGDNLFSLWHASARAARVNERRARLLSEAAVTMAGAGDPAALYAAMPRLLSDVLDFTHAEVFTEEGDGYRSIAAHRADLARDFRVPPTSVVGRAWRTGAAQYVHDVRADPDYVSDTTVAPTRSELALPLHAGGRVRAVLNVEHDAVDGFDEADHRTLEAFVRMAQEVLARLLALQALESQGSEQALIARLANRLLLADGTREAAAATLAEVVPGLGVEAGAVVRLQAGRLRAIASQGSVPAELRRRLNEGIAVADGPSLAAWTSGRPQWIADATADPTGGSVAREFGARALGVVPVADASGEVQAVLALIDSRAARAWSTRDRRLLDIVATSLGAVLERATLSRQLAALLDGVRGLARADAPDELYARAADAAVKVIPGAEGTSILVRGPDGFQYQAAVGFELEKLRRLGPFSEQQALAWYRDGSDGYRRGRPRIVRATDMPSLSSFWDGPKTTDGAEAARIHDIAANVCVPIAERGEVIAVLNVDSFSDPSAFGSTALRLAEVLAQQVAAVVRQAETLEELQRSATTDPLTGLGNRAGFRHQLDLELARARRHDHGLAILMLDLDGFKQINDRYGHPAGDEVLARVAGALLQAARGSDSVFRWGGDEFVLILPEVTPRNSGEIAGRFAAAVASVAVHDMRLGASAGTACFPVDGEDASSLVRRADERMYRTKQRSPRPGGTSEG